MKKIIIYISVIFLLSCGNNKQETPAAITSVDEKESVSKPEEPEADAVSSATAVENDVTFNGIIVIPPDKQATITLPINGIVKSIHLLPGKYVKKGDLLATLEDPAFINLQQSFLENHAQAEYLEKEFQRQQILSNEEAASKKKFEQSKAEYLSMKSRRDGDASQLVLLGINPSRVLEQGIIQSLEVRAPISGYISEMQVNTGKYVHTGDALCEIIDKSRTLIKMTVYEKDLARIDTGNDIEFRINGLGAEETFSGKIISVGQQVDNLNRSLEAYVQVDGQDSRFRPGMYVNVKIQRK